MKLEDKKKQIDDFFNSHTPEQLKEKWDKYERRQKHSIMKQKFKRGNRVKILVGSIMWSSKNGKTTTEDMSPEDVGRTALIDYSYSERYGGNDVDSYSIIWEDNGSSFAWKHTNEMELIDEGGEHLFEEAKAKRDKISKQNTEFDYIVTKIDEGNVSSETILFLFNIFGFKTSFYNNGEFYVLFSDWNNLQPFFKYIKNAKSLEDAKSCLTEEGNEKFNVELIYNEFKKALEKNM